MSSGDQMRQKTAENLAVLQLYHSHDQFLIHNGHNYSSPKGSILMKTRILGLLAATALTTAGISAASAADLPFRAAPPAPMIAAVPVFTWTGFYVGVNAGYGWQNNDNNSSIFVPAGTFVTAPAASGTITFADDEGEGFVGGGQIGYNYQFGSFVLGVQADRQGAALGGGGGPAFGRAGFPASFVPAGTAGGIDWFGTVRARAGVAFGQALVYATGGFAFGGAGDKKKPLRLGQDDGGGPRWGFG